MLRPVQPRDNCHTVYMGCERLCVECKVCNHRTALASRRFYQGNMQELRSLNLKCTSCQGRDVAMLLPQTVKEAEDWARGVEPVDHAQA